MYALGSGPSLRPGSIAMRTLTSVVADVNGEKGAIFVITVDAGAPGNMP